MAKNTPAFQFYPQDFIGGVMLLDNATVGVYIKLLSALWIANNKLPNEFKQLARATLCDASEFNDAWHKLQDKFEIADNMISHPRFTQMIELREKRKASGSLGGVSRVANAQANSQANTQANAKQTPSKVMKNEERSMKNENSRSKFISPTVKDVAEYAIEKGLTIDPNAFVDFYESKGWKVGSTKMKDWQACARNWSRRNVSKPSLRTQDLPRSVKNEIAARQMKEAARKQHCEQKRIEKAK
tara:strand:+ start:9694 stop:10422 length:729 start_codon:yes stop_codon:yes gene_type:complete